jgi:hypothetical protein
LIERRCGALGLVVGSLTGRLMFALLQRMGWVARASVLATFALVLPVVSAPDAQAALNPAGPDGTPFRCCFRYEVEEYGSFGLSFGANAPANEGTWGGEWDWTTIGIYTLLEDGHGRGELYSLAADEKDGMEEVDDVKDLVYDETTNSYVWVADNTNNSRGKNCERSIRQHGYHSVGALGGANIFTFGPLKDVGPDSPQGEFGCSPGGEPTPGSAGNGIPTQFKPFYGDPFGNVAIPHPAYASFASGDAIHVLTCTFSGFGSYNSPADIATGKAAKAMAIHVQFFPESKLGRAEKALKSDSQSGFHFGDVGTSLEFDFGAVEAPSTPFKNPPKNGCRKGD